MMSKQLRLGVDNFGPPLLECSCNARVQRLSRSTQQCAVSRISHQRMLEKKGRSRWRPSAKYKPGISQSRKRACHLFLALLSNQDQQFVGELPPDRRRDLRNFLRRFPQPVQPGQEGGMKGCRNCKCRTLLI